MWPLSGELTPDEVINGACLPEGDTAVHELLGCEQVGDVKHFSTGVQSARYS
jgi:hypothetical protein